MATNRLAKYSVIVIVLILSVAFVIKFGGPNILRQYVAYGIGSCKDIPILCMQPEDNIFTPQINPEYRLTLVPQAFPKMSLSAPKGFTLVQELITKPYYKKKRNNHQAVIYLLYQEPKSFIKLYPDVRKQGVNDNYEFIRRVMYSGLDKVKDITSAFFVIMKSVFTPDIGNQGTAKMIRFEINGLRGFINYTMTGSQTAALRPNNYFDCSIFDTQGSFFKVYIKDTGARLDLNNVFTIISTIKAA